MKFSLVLVRTLKKLLLDVWISDGPFLWIKYLHLYSAMKLFFVKRNFTLNLQTICDKRNKNFWNRSIHLGNMHNSTSWSEACWWGYWKRWRIFLNIVDYCCFFMILITLYHHIFDGPLPNALVNASKDTSNYILSNSRNMIYFETFQ